MGKVPHEELERMIIRAQAQVPLGSIWRHCKGSRYTVEQVVIIEVTTEIAVVYAPLDYPMISFVRPISV